MRTLLWAALVLVLPLGAAEMVQRDVFVSGENGYHTFRIPALLATKAGTLLAFCEGRKAGKGDSGNIDLVLKRSTDGGKTWSALSVVWDDGGNSCGNPCPVLDEQTGAILLLMTHNAGGDSEKAIRAGTAASTRTVWLSRSGDDGQSWSPPADITPAVKKASWRWYATGPGIGIQIKHGKFAGRLVVPCDHTEGNTVSPMGSHVIYSDDHGASWQAGGSIEPNMNECQVVELAAPDGSLLLNMRSYLPGNRRAESISGDGGIRWSAPHPAQDLIDPVCQGSIFRYTWPSAHQKGRILFSNCASTHRQNLTLRMSEDDAKTWRWSKVLHAGPAAYSCLAALPNGTICCLYECGEHDPYEKITLTALMAGSGGEPFGPLLHRD